VTSTVVVPSRISCLGLLLALGSGLACARQTSSPVRLNEVLPSNSNDCADEVGERNDWLELYNLGDSAVDLAGYSLTDDTASPRKSVIPEGVSIEAHATLLFWADDTIDQGKTHLAFKFKKITEEVVLYDTNEVQVDLFRWSNGVSDVSFARVPDGSGEWIRCGKPTCGAANACGSP
jgi:hypothetical protein